MSFSRERLYESVSPSIFYLKILLYPHKQPFRQIFQPLFGVVGALVSEFDVDAGDPGEGGLGEVHVVGAVFEDLDLAGAEAVDQFFAEAFALFPVGGDIFEVFDAVGHGDVEGAFVVVFAVGVPVEGNVAGGEVVAEDGAGDVVELDVDVVAEHEDVEAGIEEFVAEDAGGGEGHVAFGGAVTEAHAGGD